MDYSVIINILGIFLGLKLLYDFGPIFRSNKSMVLGNIDLVEVSYFIIVFSVIGNITFISSDQLFWFELLGGMASCVVHLFLNWALSNKYGKLNKKRTNKT